jgi:hypothetical protein
MDFEVPNFADEILSHLEEFNSGELSKEAFEKNYGDSIKTLDENKPPTIGTDGFRYEFDSEGKAKIFNGDVEITQENLKKASEATLKEGDVLQSLKELGYPDKILSEPEIKQYAEEYKAKFETTDAFKENKTLQENDNAGKTLSDQVGDPKTQEEFKKLLETNKELKTQFDELSKKLEEQLKKEGEGSEAGNWAKESLKTLLKYAGGALAGELLYKAIKGHQNAMNGCWLVKGGSGEKCKIALLTCHPDAKTNGDLCPGKISISDLNSCTPCVTPPPGQNTGPCFDTTTCVECDKGNCKTKMTDCNDDTRTCSEFCGGNSSVQVPKGYYLQCVNIDFWAAANDVANDIIDTPFSYGGDVVKKIIMILVWIAVAVVIMVVLYFVISFVIQRMETAPERAAVKKAQLLKTAAQTSNAAAMTTLTPKRVPKKKNK